jgi:hypothetical protein
MGGWGRVPGGTGSAGAGSAGRIPAGAASCGRSCGSRVPCCGVSARAVPGNTGPAPRGVVDTSATGDIRSCPGVPCPGADRPGSSPVAADRPTGRIAASRRPSDGPWSPLEVGVSLCGVNQPLPPLPPEVPLSADVGVGASMVCLASNIFRSVCAHPRPEDMCFPPRTACPLPRFSPCRPDAATSKPDFRPVRTSGERT